jgi:hypothetical protein
MKQKIYFTIVTLILIILFDNCTKESKSKSSLLQAKVNNFLMTFSGHVRKDLSGNFWGIGGSDASGNEFTVTCPISTGTYQFLSMYSGTMSEAFYTKDHNYNHQYHSSNGSITITTNSGNNIKGNFNFHGIPFDSSDVVEVTEGTFNIDF